MTTPGPKATTPRTRRLCIAAIVTATLASLAAALYIIDTRTDAISCALHISARLDSSTPARQGGFELVSISRPKMYESIMIQTGAGRETIDYLTAPGDTVVGIRASFMPPLSKPDSRTWHGALRAHGRSSTGSEFEFPVATTYRIDYSSVLVTSVPPAVAVVIRGSYPASYKWIDLTVETLDKARHATWRIVNLPRTHRAIPDTAGVNSTVASPDGARAHCVVRRWAPWSRDYDCGFSTELLKDDGKVYWQFTPSPAAAQYSWETRDAAISRRGLKPTIDIPWWTLRFNPPRSPDFDAMMFCGYPETRRARVFGEFAQVAVLDEKVTFTNIPTCRGWCSGLQDSSADAALILNPSREMKAVTPSGIVVRMQSGEHAPSQINATNANLEIEPSAGRDDQFAEAPFVRIPLSPLYKKYGKDIQIAVQMEGQSGRTSRTLPGFQSGYTFSGLRHSPPTMKSATFVIRQRCILKTIPASFTFDPAKMPTIKPDLCDLGKATRTP
ncbi:MAG TPA: hypothetical protein VGK19_22775 [Capsulimonadaceae bacterium]|jgi:hypothetical protein